MSSKDLKALFLAHQRELRAYLTDRFRDSDMAADLTQETFLRYAEQAPSVPQSSVRAYLFRTAHNLGIDQLRRRWRQRTDNGVDGILVGLPEDAPSPEERAASRNALDRLKEAVDELPERTRQILILNRVEGLTYREIAERLDISDSTVQKNLAKALHHVMQRVPKR